MTFRLKYLAIKSRFVSYLHFFTIIYTNIQTFCCILQKTIETLSVESNRDEDRNKQVAWRAVSLWCGQTKRSQLHVNDCFRRLQLFIDNCVQYSND